VHRRRFVALLAVLALVGAACNAGTDNGPSGGDVKAGGTFRVEIDEFPWEQGYGFDPTVEFVGDDWAVLKQLLVRGLTSYKFLPADEGGSEVITDIAEGLGEYNEDNTSVTYTLKEGVMFGDPVNREVTSADILTAFERLGTAELTAGGYASYYTALVEGMAEFEAGDADTISGIQTPDAQTITFNFVEPVFDWDYRMAMPAAAAIPAEASKCFTGYAEYGNFVVSSGPYQIEGMDEVDFTADCRTVKRSPPSGFSLEDHMYLVRNPLYAPETDDTTARESLPDRFEFTKNTNVTNSYDKMERGEIDYPWATPPAPFIRKYSTTDDLKPYLHSTLDNATWYLTLTLTEAPFDDLFVRKAVAQVLDKSGMLRVQGGPTTGVPAEHVIPPSVLGGDLPPGEYDPYPSEGHAGDVEAALEFMKQSSYETDADGLCTDPACKGLVHVTRETEPFPKLAGVVEDSLEKLGLTFRPTVRAASFYGEAGTPAKPVEVTSGSGWGPDWAEPLTFFEFPALGSSISIANNINIPMIGFTAEIAASLNAQYQAASEADLRSLRIQPPEQPLPSIQEEFDGCRLLPLGDERHQCWVDLDKHMMEDVLGWIPWRWSNDTDIVAKSVTQYAFDTFSGNIAFSHVAVDEAQQL